MKKLNTYYLIVALAVVVVLKLWYRGLDADQPGFILAALAYMVESFTGAASTALPGEGYYFASLNIIINKSCSGFNFCCMCFFLLCFVAATHLGKGKLALLYIVPGALLLSYGITVFVNTSRILMAVFINNRITTSGHVPPGWLHVTEGIFIYLFFLILIYLLAGFIITKLSPHHEKPI